MDSDRRLAAAAAVVGYLAVVVFVTFTVLLVLAYAGC